MNLYDQLFKEYLSITEIFANIFNVFCFDGKNCLHPDKLERLEIWNRPWLYLYPEYDFAETYAAAFQNAVLMSDDQALYLLIVIGSQDRYFHPTPLAVASFETYYYSYQLNGGASKIEKPFFPLAIYLGKDDWTSPITFRDLAAGAPGQEGNTFFNYKIPLLQPGKLDDHTLSGYCKLFQDMTSFIECGNEAYLIAFLKDEILTWTGHREGSLGSAELLRDKNVLADILKSAIDEYKDLPLPQIAAKYVGNTLKTETIQSEQGPEYALQFSAASPVNRKSSIVRITVLTGEYDSEYPLIKRGLFEASELISGQDVDAARPEEVQKVYSIWILKKALRPDRAGSIVCYDVQERRMSLSGEILSQSRYEDGLISILVFSLDQPGALAPENAEILTNLAVLLN